MRRRSFLFSVAGLAVPMALYAQYTVPSPLPGQPNYGQDPGQLVRSWYLRFLKREPDWMMKAWVDALVSGQTPEMVLAGILGSDEYYVRVGNTPEGFIQNLFTDITGRPPSGREFPYWVQRVYSEQRQNIAYALLMRHPQVWQSPSPPVVTDNHLYDYRRPTYRYR